MAAAPAKTDSAEVGRVPAGALPAWTVGDLPEPPRPGWKSWAKMIGPGVLLAGASVGSGEWLFGPAVSALYGGTLLWIGTLSIVSQLFANLQMMRYAVYCGESIIIGYLRTWPGPRFWIVWYAMLDLAAIWPFNASNAAVPLAAAILGRLPGEGDSTVLGWALSDTWMVKLLGYAIFLASFIPLIFGGTIYRMLRAVMGIKLVLVLGYLCVATALLVSRTNAWEIVTGLVKVGVVPLRAETVVAGPHFTIGEQSGDATISVKGTIEQGNPLVTEVLIDSAGERRKFGGLPAVPKDLRPSVDRLIDRAVMLAQPGRFFIERIRGGSMVVVEGGIDGGEWKADQYVVAEAGGREEFSELVAVPEPFRGQVAELVDRQGCELTTFPDYWSRRHDLPRLDWAMLASFAAIAGAGGLSNTLFSNFARDAGWGMGKNVGAIPSAVGGMQISLSHVGETFRPTEENRRRWQGWLRHVRRDQVAIWTLASVVGLALPCMLSLEFIRHAPVGGNRVAAMMAGGMADRYPDLRGPLWSLTLIVGFLILAPGQVFAGDIIARRWSDIIWTASKKARNLPGHQITKVYYSILAGYAAWGMIALTLFDPLEIAKLSAVLMNIALGWSALHSVYVNRSLLPAENRSSLVMEVGAIVCGVFFLAISGIVFATL